MSSETLWARHSEGTQAEGSQDDKTGAVSEYASEQRAEAFGQFSQKSPLFFTRVTRKRNAGPTD